MQPDQVEQFVRAWLADRLGPDGSQTTELTAASSLIGESLIDSLGFLELVTAVEPQFGIELDFSEADPEEFVTLGGFVVLCRAASLGRAA